MDPRRRVLRYAMVLAALLTATGCVGDRGASPATPPALLPASVRLHPFTGTRQFSERGGINGIEARVEAIDHFGDATKAFGTFRFEVFSYRPRQSDPRGKRLATWASDLTDASTNMQHWDNISRTYRFRLAWDKPIPIGEKFVLRTVFDGPDGPRLFDQRVFVSGQ